MTIALLLTTGCGGGAKPASLPSAAPVNEVATSAPDAGATTIPEPPPPPTADASPPETDPTKVPPLPADKGKAPKLRIEALKITFAKGMLRDTEIELKKDGAVSLDGKKVGKITGNRVTIAGRPKQVVLRSDGYVEQTGDGFGKGFHMKATDDSLTNDNGAVTQIQSDGTITATPPGQPAQTIGNVTGDLKTTEAKRTAVLLVGLELLRPPDFSRAKKEADDAVKQLQQMQSQPAQPAPN